MNDKKLQRRNLRSRFLYDFGNSFFIIAIGGLFFAQWIILDNKIPDIRYGGSFSLATLLVLITAPLLGARSDKKGVRKPFITWTTIGLIIANALMAIVALSNISHQPYIMLGLFVIIQYLYQISLIFYNTLLKNVSSEENRGQIAGIGDGMGSLGRLVALPIFLPLISCTVVWFGSPGRTQVFLPAFILSTIFMLPLLFRFKEHKTNKIEHQENVYSKTRQGIRKLFTIHRNVGKFLLAYCLLSDIILTVNLYFAVVMTSVYKVNDSITSVILGILLISTMIMGYLLGKLGDRYGYKKIIILACMILIVLDIIFFLGSAQRILYMTAIFGGIGVGGYYSVTRAFMTKISPPEELGEYFGLYSTFEKFASITAPLIRGGMTLRLASYPVLKYRVAGLVMVGLLIVGTILMMRVKEPK